MSKSGWKSREMKHVTFRMTSDAHADYVAVARSRGMDLSALLNWVVSDYRPLLLMQQAEHDAAMFRAVAAGPPLSSGAGTDQQQALEKVNEVIRQLQDVAARLAASVGGGSQSAA